MSSAKPTQQLLDDGTVRHVALLARIAITDAEAGLYAEQLSKILYYVGQLNELNTDDVPPTEHPLEASDVVRADVPTGSISTGDALRNTPDRQGDYFRVPQVLEQDDA